MPQQQDQKPATEDKAQAEQKTPAGQPSPGLKDKEAETSNSYGHTRESGETPKN
jgi:hypothetical protein